MDKVNDRMSVCMVGNEAKSKWAMEQLRMVNQDVVEEDKEEKSGWMVKRLNKGMQ